MIKYVNIGGMAFTNNCDDIIVTHSLSSCVAVTSYCPVKKVGAMIHIALPLSNGNLNLKQEGYYADIGLPLFLSNLYKEFNCSGRDLDIRLFGGANSWKENDVFDIGGKNLNMVRQILNQKSLRFKEVSTGGHVSRTIELYVNTGEVKVIELPLKI